MYFPSLAQFALTLDQGRTNNNKKNTAMLPQLALAAAPTGVKLLNELFNPSRESEYEKKLREMQMRLEGDANAPVTQNRVYTEGKSVIDQADTQNRESIGNVVGGGNVTNEAKLAGMDDANSSYMAALNRLMSNAQRFREFSAGQSMNALGSLENAKNNRLTTRQNNTASWMNPLSNSFNAMIGAQNTGE